MHAYLHIYIRVHMYLHTSTYTHVHMYLHTHAYTHVHMYLHSYIYIHTQREGERDSKKKASAMWSNTPVPPLRRHESKHMTFKYQTKKWQKRIELPYGQMKLKCVHVIENATLHLLYSLDHTELRQWPGELTSLGFKSHRLQGSVEHLVTDGHAQNRMHQHGCSGDAWTAQSCQCGSRACLCLSLVSLQLSGQSLEWAIPVNLILEQKLGRWMCKIKKSMGPLKLKLVSCTVKRLVFLPKASLYCPIGSLIG